ncbi:MAG: iron chelate uptake ABC transporter family permease subunit [Syntrophomonadaceae bacterium]|nr:iron chelate uptake ABC transporter family permease subunit [Syntrophomonadaceae bacterium]
MIRNNILKRSVMFALLIIVLLGAFVLGISIGAVFIPPAEVVRILFSHIPGFGSYISTGLQPEHEIIIIIMRFPRVMLAALVGAGLALAGATFQGLFRNPMADPYVIGVSSGAALGAVSSILFQLIFNIPAHFGIPAFAFIFAVMTIFLVYNLAKVGGKVPVMTLLLAGIAVNSLISALVSLCMFFSGDQLHQVVFWLMGGFSGRGWDYVYMFIPYGVVGSIVIFIYARELNAMLLGEEPAQHLGVEVEQIKRRLLIAAALLTGACVSVSGLIGFVGLVIPHIVRMLFGPDHRILLPAVALIGAAFLLIADVLARVIIAPGELPVGIITALIGGPFFIYLLRRQKHTMF